MSLMVFSICQDPKILGLILASEGMNLPTRVRASRQRGKISFFHVLYAGC